MARGAAYAGLDSKAPRHVGGKSGYMHQLFATVDNIVTVINFNVILQPNPSVSPPPTLHWPTQANGYINYKLNSLAVH